MKVLHPVFGYVRIKEHGTTHRISARWVGQELWVTMPKGLSEAEYNRFLDRAKDKLLSLRPAPMHAIGHIIDGPLADFTIAVSTDISRDARIDVRMQNVLRGKSANYTIYIRNEITTAGIDNAPVQDFINRNVLIAARHATTAFVLPIARRLAEEVGVSPVEWKVKDAKTRLGSCSSSRVITLSPRLIFLPEELRDYIIYHELAHLSEMNHSAAFHRLCNRYCRGRETEYIARVKSFRFPVF